MDLMGTNTSAQRSLYSSKHVQRQDRVEVNGADSSGTWSGMPPTTAAHGASTYDKVFRPNSWRYAANNGTTRAYNDTKVTIMAASNNDV